MHGWDGPARSALEGMIAAFTAAFPHVVLESEQVDRRALRDVLVTSLAGGAPPNAVVLRSDSASYFAETRSLRPLDDLMTGDGVRTDWFAPGEIASRSWDGQVYGLPHVAAGAEQLLYVNLGLLERMGLDPSGSLATWTELEPLIEPARRVGALAIDPTRCGAGILGLQVWTYANGGRWLDETARRITWADGPVVEAARWLQRIVVAQRGVAGLPALAESGGSPLTVQEWVAEKHVCAINDAEWSVRLEQEAPQLRFAVYDLPRADAVAQADRRSPSFGGWLLAIPREARDHTAAWEWLKFATLSDAAYGFSASQGRPSTLAAPHNSTPSAAGRPVAPVVFEAQKRSLLVPGLPIGPQLDDLAQAAEAALLKRNQDPRPLLESTARSAQQLLDEWTARRRRS